MNGISSHEEEEINELQEDDRELFSDQLSSIGMLGRVAADHCIPLLTRLNVFPLLPCHWRLFCESRGSAVLTFPAMTVRLVTSPCSLLEDRVTRLHGQLQRTQQHLMASPDPGSVDRKVLDDLYEDIHWLILVSGQQRDVNLCLCLFFTKRTFWGFRVWNTRGVGTRSAHKPLIFGP